MSAAVLAANELGLVHPETTCADAFKKIIEEEQAAIRTEQEAKRLAKEAAALQLREARRAAQAVRDRILHPMLNSLCETLTQGKVLPHWEVKLADDGNQFCAMLTATREPPGRAKPAAIWGDKAAKDDEDVSICASRGPHGTWKRLSIRAVVSVIDGGPSLSMSVVWPKEFSEGHPVVNTRDLGASRDGKCDDSAIALWYQTQLQDCARRCVRFAAEEVQA
jgi:hypothetical protein